MEEEISRVRLPSRLGNVLYRVACTVAFICIFLGILGFVVLLFHLNQDAPSMADNIFMLVFGVFVWAAARGARFVLTGRPAS
jgi:hypothetical protein